MSEALALSNEGFSNKLKACKDYSQDVISNVYDLLTNKGLQNVILMSPTEIRITNGDKKYVKSVIEQSTIIPPQLVSLLIDIGSCKSDVVIRQKRR